MKHIHYTATLVIKRVEWEDGRPEVPTRQGNLIAAGLATRKVGDVVNLVIRAADIENLKSKLKDHLIVIDDDKNMILEEGK